jgi:hypothetical protein
MKTGRPARRVLGLVSLLIAVLVGSTCEDPTSVILDLTATSEVVAGHSHSCTIPGRDITVAPMEGGTYTTTAAATSTIPSHTHTVTLSYQNLVDLQQAHAAILVESSSSQGHTHRFLFER